MVLTLVTLYLSCVGEMSNLLELKRFLQADLRERHGLVGNGSTISRLPLWIKLGKNREKLLKLVAKLEKIYQSSIE